MSNNLLSYFNKLNKRSSSSNSSDAPQPPSTCPPTAPLLVVEDSVDDYPSDPGLRRNISLYHANEREIVRRFYLQKGPCQPRNYTFPWHIIGQSEKRRFIPSWFNDHSTWLEYSITKDAAFCLYCYLFKPEHGGQSGGDSFVGDGFRNWKKKERFNVHVGPHSSIHNNCVRAGDDLMKQKQHIEVSLSDHSTKMKNDYRARLTASIDCIKFLLRQGLPLRGRDESEDSSNNHFNEVNTELLLCMACLSPSDAFSSYDKGKLIRFAEFYPLDFSSNDLMQLNHQLDNYILDLKSDSQFSEVEGISALAKKMVQRKKHRLYPLVYLLLKLALLLPVATATVERVFSAMKIIKSSLRNRLGDDVMNDCLVPYVERDIADTIGVEEIIQHFQNMKSRRVCL